MATRKAAAKATKVDVSVVEVEAPTTTDNSLWFNNVTLDRADTKESGVTVFYATTKNGHKVRGISKFIKRFEVGTQVSMNIVTKNGATFVNALIPFVAKAA